MFGPNVETMRKSGDVAGLLAVLLDSRRKKSKQAYEALCSLDEAALPALIGELLGGDRERSLAAALGIGAMLQGGSSTARTAACSYVSRPAVFESACILLDALAKEPSGDAAKAVVEFLQTPQCPLCRSRTRDEIHIMPNRMTANQLMSLMMQPDDQQESLVSAFRILESYPLPEAEPYLIRGLVWRDPEIDAFADELRAREEISHELARVRNAQMRVRCAAAAALAKYDSMDTDDALLQCVDDEDQRVASAACEALGR